jgi:RNA polymerase sigma-70 factor, ECF subfamily
MPDEQRIEQEDRELIRRIASKDADAMDAFYTRYNRLAFSLVFRIVSNREDAEDVLVDVFWQIWQQASRYDASRGKPVAWLLTISRTRAIDYLRSRGGKAAGSDEIEQQSQAAERGSEMDVFVLADTRKAVQSALQSLPEQQRVPLELAYFQGMTHSEIADTLRQPLGTIKDRVRNGMMHLKKRLKPYL